MSTIYQGSDPRFIRLLLKKTDATPSKKLPEHTTGELRTRVPEKMKEEGLRRAFRDYLQCSRPVLSIIKEHAAALCQHQEKACVVSSRIPYKMA